MWSRVLGPDLACWSPEGLCVKRSRVPLCSSRLAPEEHLPTGNCTAHASAGISFPRLPPERYLLRLQRDRRESGELVSNILIVSKPFAALNFRSASGLSLGSKEGFQWLPSITPFMNQSRDDGAIIIAKPTIFPSGSCRRLGAPSPNERALRPLNSRISVGQRS